MTPRDRHELLELRLVIRGASVAGAALVSGDAAPELPPDEHQHCRMANYAYPLGISRVLGKGAAREGKERRGGGPDTAFPKIVTRTNDHDQ